MNRRSFICSVVGLAAAPLALATGNPWSEIETVFIPPNDGLGTGDVLAYHGHYGAQGVYRGQRYGVLFKLSWKNPKFTPDDERARRGYAVYHLKRTVEQTNNVVLCGSGHIPEHGKVVRLA